MPPPPPPPSPPQRPSAAAKAAGEAATAATEAAEAAAAAAATVASDLSTSPPPPPPSPPSPKAEKAGAVSTSLLTAGSFSDDFSHFGDWSPQLPGDPPHTGPITFGELFPPLPGQRAKAETSLLDYTPPIERAGGAARPGVVAATVDKLRAAVMQTLTTRLMASSVQATAAAASAPVHTPIDPSIAVRLAAPTAGSSEPPGVSSFLAFPAPADEDARVARAAQQAAKEIASETLRAERSHGAGASKEVAPQRLPNEGRPEWDPSA